MKTKNNMRSIEERATAFALHLQDIVHASYIFGAKEQREIDMEETYRTDEDTLTTEKAVLINKAIKWLKDALDLPDDNIVDFRNYMLIETKE